MVVVYFRGNKYDLVSTSQPREDTLTDRQTDREGGKWISTMLSSNTNNVIWGKKYSLLKTKLEIRYQREREREREREIYIEIGHTQTSYSRRDDPAQNLSSIITP